MDGEVIGLVEKATVAAGERQSCAGRIDRNDEGAGDSGEECGEADDEVCVMHVCGVVDF